MAKLTREDFISALKEMTILEVKELVDAMKEEFGVDPSAVAVAAAPAAGEAAADNAAKTVTGYSSCDFYFASSSFFASTAALCLFRPHSIQRCTPYALCVLCAIAESTILPQSAQRYSLMS